LTDGVTEALDERGELYGAARVENTLKSLAPENAPGSVLEALREDVKRFAGSAPLADDVTLVALRWRGAT
jgi:sigma-B regulation protein RsbU (phosphoserine phosphatase)